MKTNMDDDNLSILANRLKNEYGFDIFHPFQTKWYNDSIDNDHNNTVPLRKLVVEDMCSPDTTTITNSNDKTCTAFLIGNTKNLWSYFVRHYKERDNNHNQKTINNDNEYNKNPLDTYVKESIETVVSDCIGTTTTKYRIYWESSYDIKNLVSMQRVAAISRLSYFDNQTMLCIHPIFGTWHSFRAVLVVENNNNSLFQNSSSCNNFTTGRQIPLPLSPPPEQYPCPLSELEKIKVNDALQYASNRTSLHSQQISITTSDYNLETVHAWIALRDCIDIGQDQYRFGTNQLFYHYTKDKKYIQYD